MDIEGAEEHNVSEITRLKFNAMENKADYLWMVLGAELSETGMDLYSA